jgi:arginyl-tRNA synthetase
MEDGRQLKFREFEEEVEEIIAQSCRDAGFKDAQVEVAQPPNDAYGDLASAVPLRLAKEKGGNPGDIAIAIASKAMEHAKKSKYVGGVSPHRGGYLNFSLNRAAFISASIADISRGDLGAEHETGERIAIEHTNVNPNKALHIGHARNLVLGDSLVRVMRYLGHRVQALNYVDDSGAQVADIIVGFKFLGIPDQAPPGVKYDVYCGDSVYTKVNQEYARNPQLKEKQSLVLKEIESGTGDIAVYTMGIVKRILQAQLSTCWRLGATYDLLNWESQLVHSKMWERIFETLKKIGYVKFQDQGENKGCWVIPDPETGEEKVVVRSDGTVVYVAKDIPYAAWKIGLAEDPFGYEVFADNQPGGVLYSTTLGGKKSNAHFGGAQLAVSVIDTRQSYLQRIVAKVLDKLREGASRRYLHRSYEVVSLSKKTAAAIGGRVRPHVGQEGPLRERRRDARQAEGEGKGRDEEEEPLRAGRVGGWSRRRRCGSGPEIRAPEAGPGQDDSVRHGGGPAVPGGYGPVPALHLRQGQAHPRQDRRQAQSELAGRDEAGQAPGDPAREEDVHARH